MVKSSEIFHGFCTFFSSLGITTEPTPSLWKYRVYYFFDSLGRMLGYDVFTEDRFTKKDGIRKLVGKRLDMTWTHPKSRNYALALEYENTKNIDGDIEKLASMSGLRVLVMYRHGFSDGEILEKIRTRLKRAGQQNSDFLILILPDTFLRRAPFKKLRAFLLDSQSKTIGLGSAEGYISANDVCCFKNTKWTKIKSSRMERP